MLIPAVAITILCNCLGGALTIAIGQNVFLKGLNTYLPVFTTGLNTAAILKAGASDVAGLVPADQLDGVRHAYALALQHTFAISVGMAGAAFLTSLTVSDLDSWIGNDLY